MDELIAFVKARLDEDEAIARAASPGPWEGESGYVTNAHVQITDFGTQGDDGDGRGPQGEADSAHIARHDPARVLREVEAKRRILEDRWGGPDHQDMHEHHVRLLAAVWSAHPDYRSEWAP